MAQDIGLIGIGLMGAALARRLAAAGFHVCGFDMTPMRQEELRRIGGEPLGSVAEVVRRCPIILIAVMTMAQVEEVVEGAGGLLDAGGPGGQRVALCTSTCEPDRIEALATRAASRGLALLDTPVSGSSQQVLQGDGFGLIAGDPEAVDAVTVILQAIYPRHQYLGSAGAGTKTKLAINHILGLNRAALAEGLVFAETLGLDLRTFLAAARQSAAYSQIMDVKGDKMIDGNFAPAGKLSQHLKDIRIMRSDASRRGQELPFLSLLGEVVEAGERCGDGERDNAVIIEELRRRRSGKSAPG